MQLHKAAVAVAEAEVVQAAAPGAVAQRLDRVALVLEPRGREEAVEALAHHPVPEGQQLAVVPRRVRSEAGLPLGQLAAERQAPAWQQALLLRPIHQVLEVKTRAVVSSADT